MSSNDEKFRVLIAITETSAVDALWQVALRHLDNEASELTAVYVSEDRWHRAASLPFTREISRVSGANADFTLQRAKQLHDEAVERARLLVNKLASDAKLKPTFEVLTGSDVTRIRQLLEGSGNLMIASSIIGRRPLLAEFEKLGCRIELVDDTARRAGEHDLNHQ